MKKKIIIVIILILVIFLCGCNEQQEPSNFIYRPFWKTVNSGTLSVSDDTHLFFGLREGQNWKVEWQLLSGSPNLEIYNGFLGAKNDNALFDTIDSSASHMGDKPYFDNGEDGTFTIVATGYGEIHVKISEFY